MANMVIQVSGRLPEVALGPSCGAHLSTVLRASVRDQAALYGLLRMLHDLGLDLLDLRQVPRQPSGSDQPGEMDASLLVDPFVVEVVVDGPVGDLALSMLASHVEVTHLATRLTHLDHDGVQEVLSLVRSTGPRVEFVTDEEG